MSTQARQYADTLRGIKWLLLNLDDSGQPLPEDSSRRNILGIDSGMVNDFIPPITSQRFVLVSPGKAINHAGLVEATCEVMILTTEVIPEDPLYQLINLAGEARALVQKRLEGGRLPGAPGIQVSSISEITTHLFQLGDPKKPDSLRSLRGASFTVRPQWTEERP